MTTPLFAAGPCPFCAAPAATTRLVAPATSSPPEGPPRRRYRLRGPAMSAYVFELHRGATVRYIHDRSDVIAERPAEEFDRMFEEAPTTPTR